LFQNCINNLSRFRFSLNRPGTLSAGCQGPARLIPFLLAISFICNVIALFAPFLRIDAFLHAERIYSLPHSVVLMWEARLYVIAVLIIGFSIVFPFIKLSALGYIWSVSTSSEQRRRLLRRIDGLGKWSMLDIFVVIIILVLTNKQFFISTTPLCGIYFFLIAILLSMVTTKCIKRLLYPDRAPVTVGLKAVKKRLADLRDWRCRTVPGLLLLSLLSLIAAIEFPFLRISEFLLEGNSFSIFRSFLALWTADARTLSLVILAFLIVCPLLSTGASVVIWFGKFSPALRGRWESMMELLSHWSMLDVFGLALLIFLFEGDALINTTVQPGLFAVASAIAISLAASAIVNRVRRRMLKISGIDCRPRIKFGGVQDDLRKK